MRLLDLLKSLLVGGLVFLLPIGVILVVGAKLFGVARQVGHVLTGAVFPGAPSEAVVLLLALALLVLLALAAGMVARTAAGRRLFAALESGVLARLPVYTILRQVIADMSGSVDRLGEDAATEVVAVHFDDHTQIGFVVDRTPAGRVVVFVPGAPSALAGSVSVVDPHRVEAVDIAPHEVLAGMRRLGGGMARLIERAGRAAS